jgi:hypothetical protein
MYAPARLRTGKVKVPPCRRKRGNGEEPSQLVFCLRKLAGRARLEGKSVAMFPVLLCLQRPESKRGDAAHALGERNMPHRRRRKPAVTPSRRRDVLGKPSSTLSKLQNSTDIAALSAQYCSRLRQPVSIIPQPAARFDRITGRNRPHLRTCVNL